MHTDKDWNTHAELHHDLSTKWDDSDAYLKKRDENFQKLWDGGGFSYYGQKITLDMVFEEILNDYWQEDIDESVLHYAQAYPESKWYKIIQEYCKDFADKYEE